MDKVTISLSGLQFHDYRYPPSTVYPDRHVGWKVVKEIDPDEAPPEVRLKSGEILSVSATQRDNLAGIAKQAGIPTVRRIDIWGLLLEPFLDTRFRREHRLRTITLLKANGVGTAERIRLRLTLAPALLAYNALHWDWCHLGLFDALDAHLGLDTKAFTKFYWRAMEIANRGREISKLS